jgi:hypothetical protein
MLILIHSLKEEPVPIQCESESEYQDPGSNKAKTMLGTEPLCTYDIYLTPLITGETTCLPLGKIKSRLVNFTIRGSGSKTTAGPYYYLKRKALQWHNKVWYIFPEPVRSTTLEKVTFS